MTAGTGRGRALRGAVALGTLIAGAAQAAPPVFTGTPITVPVASVGQTAAVNLRQQGVISGSASIEIDTNQGVVLINGAPSSLFQLVYVEENGDAFGRVCLGVTNLGYTPAPGDVLTVDLTLENENNERAQSAVRIVLGPGPTIDPGNQQQLLACEDPNLDPVANAGADRTIPDTNGQPGESVTLQGSATDPEGEQITYSWYLNINDAPIATGATPTVTLPDGVNTLTLEVLDEQERRGTDTVTITVGASAAPTANAGADRVVADTDLEPGEAVRLDGTQSSDADGTIVAYQWFRRVDAETEEPLGTGATLDVRLPDGRQTVRLVVTDNVGNTGSDTVDIDIAVAPLVDVLAEIPGLTPHQQKVASAVDRVCADLFAADAGEQALSGDQQDLLRRCRGLLIGNSTANQISALDELVTDDFAVARTQTLLFANTQYTSVMDRLMALRGGARGLSLAGLNITIDGKSVPLAQLQQLFKGALGGGASGDAVTAADAPGGLLSDKWGMWARGNYSFGDRDGSAASPRFEADQWALVGGIDYRLSDRAVVGLSLAYGSSDVEFDPSSEGSLATDSWAASVYGSLYAAKNFYFDAILNVADVGYDARRNITYVDGSGLVDEDARGDTGGMTYSGGVSAGYDFLVGGLTLSPTLGFFHIDATIDSFVESGAGGLNLIYDEQQFQSTTGSLGMRVTYAWNRPWGVLLPHLRVDYVREFQDDVEVFGVRFAADPNANSAPPILVETDNPDQSYWRLAAGFSAQFKLGLSGYVEYQRLESFELISFQDVSVGLRLQRSFR